MFGWAVGLSLALGAVGVAGGVAIQNHQDPIAAHADPIVAELSISSLDWGSSKKNADGSAAAEAIDSNTKFYFSSTDSNTGKYYTTSPAGARMYQTGNPSITILAQGDARISSITITYNVKNGGVLHTSNATEIGENKQAYKSATAIPLSNVTSFTAYVGNTESATNGQVAIAAISVSYSTSIAVTSVTLDKTSADLYKSTSDNTVTLTPTVSPLDATVKTVSWSTNNSNVATVAGGVVTAVNPGTATITVTTTDGSKTATCAITVWSATALAISNPPESGVKTHYLAGDDPDHTGLVATITWSDGSNTKQEDVSAKATWDDSGAVAAEDESVFFSAAYAGVNDEFELAIEVAAEAKYPESVSLSYADTTLFVGEDQNASTGYLPNDANQLDFGFSSSDATVLSVDSDGTVHALKAGNASITYFSDYDGKRDTVKATVNFTVENVPPTGITLSASSGSISEDAEGTLDFTVTVEGSPTIPGYNVSVTDSTIVTASKSGNTVSLTPKKAGSTTVVITSIATPVQSAIYTVTVTAVPRYTLVTDITELTIGNKVVFVDSSATNAMKLYVSGNNIKSETISEESEGVIKKSDSFAAYTIGADQYGYTFQGEDSKYLYAASTSSNQLKSRAALNNDLNDRWTVSIDSETNIASVASVGNTDHGVMQFNRSLFACYGTASQTDIKIYVLDANPSAADKVETFSQLYMHKGDVETSEGGSDKCVSEGWFAAAKKAIDGDWSSIAADFAASGDMWTRFVNWGAAQTPKVVVTYNDGIKYSANYLAGRLVGENKGNTIALVAVFAGVGALAVGGMVFLRKRKEF